MSEPDLPPDMALLCRIVDGESPQVRYLFQYALTILLIEDGEAGIVERCIIDTREGALSSRR